MPHNDAEAMVEEVEAAGGRAAVTPLDVLSMASVRTFAERLPVVLDAAF